MGFLNPDRANQSFQARSLEEATRIQGEMAPQVVARDSFCGIRTVAGADCAYEPDGLLVGAAVCLLDFPELRQIECSGARDRLRFPYRSGFLAFREGPAVLKVFSRMARLPDLLVCDGHGLLHPRRFGLACHLGVLLDVPAIGVGKSTWTKPGEEPDMERGSWAPVELDGEIIGAALRTRSGVKPVYVSVGHKISLQTALQRVLDLCPKYRLPEPIRRAHATAERTLL